MAFSATWNRKRIASNQALLGTAPDPAHSYAPDHDEQWNTNPTPDSWVSTAENPGTVALLVGENTIYADQVGGGGPIDYTPVDHTTGDGVGAGLSDEASQAQNAAMRNMDFNATASRRWHRPADTDGDNVAERLTTEDPGANWLGSMNTVMLKVGTNKESYPNTRPGWRIHRWRDRVYARESFTTDHRPLYTPNAYFTGQHRPAGNSYLVSPYPQQGHVNTVMEKAPQLRRTPPVWSEQVTHDGYQPAYAPDAAPDVWGQ